MKIDYISETATEPKLRAWLMPADPDDEIEDPRIPRPDGWRLQIETVEDIGPEGLIRSAWEWDIRTVLMNMGDYWETEPVWKVCQTGEMIDLYTILGLPWKDVNRVE